jgi:hypothetical protein
MAEEEIPPKAQSRKTTLIIGATLIALAGGGKDDVAQRLSALRLASICPDVTCARAPRFRARSCFNHSSMDGRAARRTNSLRRNSCIDFPCLAARAASSSRTRSGTSRIVI